MRMGIEWLVGFVCIIGIALCCTIFVVAAAWIDPEFVFIAVFAGLWAYAIFWWVPIHLGQWILS